MTASNGRCGRRGGRQANPWQHQTRQKYWHSPTRNLSENMTILACQQLIRIAVLSNPVKCYVILRHPGPNGFPVLHALFTCIGISVSEDECTRPAWCDPVSSTPPSLATARSVPARSGTKFGPALRRSVWCYFCSSGKHQPRIARCCRESEVVSMVNGIIASTVTKN